MPMYIYSFCHPLWSILNHQIKLEYFDLKLVKLFQLLFNIL